MNAAHPIGNLEVEALRSDLAAAQKRR